MFTIDSLKALLSESLPDQIQGIVADRGELTLVVSCDDYHSVCEWLHKNEFCSFDTMIDLCGVDYSCFSTKMPKRFAVVLHLLSVAENCRLRVRTFCADDSRPLLSSVTDVWPCANWFEREAFDLFGVIFTGHPDLRRILTDYGFVGHPFRKDFPVSGYLEISYDDSSKRLSYLPVSIEPRINVPYIIREDNYGGLGGIDNG
ncbi:MULTISPECIES: NADH-quinone oxidoreductase subunit C [Candidatus Ichthyocystis]|uniref:NADH-quinone oxidoreductase subunit C n=1 Tax=Candidatus Ichthyocystis hellenicum TaxID=1561003 RepID=A0A0S4M256_9BURK|nr:MULTISPECIES: NADH-quinone oxidoreductase subunit C [Ichthyocystis]CUT17849.1 NADH-quinone oxidoreductase subunit C [Candidatus Ichthyocystis hellenicum]